VNRTTRVRTATVCTSLDGSPRSFRTASQIFFSVRESMEREVCFVLVVCGWWDCGWEFRWVGVVVDMAVGVWRLSSSHRSDVAMYRSSLS